MEDGHSRWHALTKIKKTSIQGVSSVTRAIIDSLHSHPAAMESFNRGSSLYQVMVVLYARTQDGQLLWTGMETNERDTYY